MTSGEPSTPIEAHARLVSNLAASLRQAGLAGSGGADVEVIETHISWVVLAGALAYKIKKPLDLGFLDFRTLAQRRHYCDEEIRLNVRLAPAVYIDVVPITGTVDAPCLSGEGVAIEYAVRMRRFSQAQLFDRLLTRGELMPHHIDELALRVAAFHGATEVAPAGGPHGRMDRIRDLALVNVDAVGTALGGALGDELSTIRVWIHRECDRLARVFRARVDDGMVRECHGDLHLANIALVDGAVTVFDCIEFNDAMRWIDVLSEVAFTVMDLEDRGQGPLAYRYLNAYLEVTGDYGGLQVLPFYLAYRAMVRAKIAALRLSQLGDSDAARTQHSTCAGYVALAVRYCTRRAPGVVAMHGLSGSGKSTLAAYLAEHLPGVRVRTDVERRRLRARGGTSPYSDPESAAVYDRVGAALSGVLDAGLTPIADGAFLERRRRADVRELAASRALPLVIVSMVAPEALLRMRISERLARRRDPSEADLDVLTKQLVTAEPLDDNERNDMVVCGPQTPPHDVALSVSERFARS